MVEEDQVLPSHASVAVLVVVAWGGAGLMVGARAICLSRQTMSGVMKKMCL